MPLFFLALLRQLARRLPPRPRPQGQQMVPHQPLPARPRGALGAQPLAGPVSPQASASGRPLRRLGPASPRRLWRPRFPVSGSSRLWRLPPSEQRPSPPPSEPWLPRLQVGLAPGIRGAFTAPSPRWPGCARLFRPGTQRAVLPAPGAAPRRAAASPPAPPAPSHRLRAGAGPPGPRALGPFEVPVAGRNLRSRPAPRWPGFPGSGGGAPPGPSQARGRPEA